MQSAIAVAALLLAGAGVGHGEALEIEGTLCRTNRSVDRLIVDSGGRRHLVAVDRSARVTFESHWYEADDLRPGDRIQLFAERDRAGILHPLRIDVQVRAGAALLDALLGTRPRLIGRFAVREARTEYFSLNVPGDDYVRVDAKAAYGPHGRVWVSTLRAGDLLEIGGTWTKKGEIRASSIHVLTDDEPGSCRQHARKGETEEATAAREAAEQRFLGGYAPEEESPDEDGPGRPAGQPPLP
jgi:hypothetical protein